MATSEMDYLPKNSMTSTLLFQNKTAQVSTINLSDNISNYKMLIIEAGYPPEPNTVAGSGSIMVDTIELNTTSLYITGGQLDRWIWIKFITDTQISLIGAKTSSDTVRSIYGVK